MGESTGISWCDSTYNYWYGCAKVSPACKHCYAEEFVTKRLKLPVWGQRRLASYLPLPITWESSSGSRRYPDQEPTPDR